MHQLLIVLQFDVADKTEGLELLDRVETFRQAESPAELLGVKWDGEYADDELDGWDS